MAETLGKEPHGPHMPGTGTPLPGLSGARLPGAGAGTPPACTADPPCPLDPATPDGPGPQGPGPGRESWQRTMPLHRLAVPAPQALPFATGSFDSIGPLSRTAFPHRHTFYEIAHVTHGSGAHVVDLHPWKLAPPQLFFITPGQAHHWERVSGPDGDVVLFDEAFLLAHPEDRELLRRLGERPPRPLDVRTAARVGAVLGQMREEYREQRPGMLSALQAHLHILLILATRVPAASRRVPLPESSTAGRAAALSGEFVRLLARPGAAAGHSVRTCAAALGVSVGRLSAAVRESTGRTPGQLIRDAQVLEAKRLLAGTTLTVGRVAREVGFADPAYFCRFFRRETGTSPGEFRRGADGNHHTRRTPSIDPPWARP